MKIKFCYMNNEFEKDYKEDELVENVLKDCKMGLKQNKLYFMYNGKPLLLKKINGKMVKDIFKKGKILFAFNCFHKKNKWQFNNIICPICKNLSIMKCIEDTITLEKCIGKHSSKYLTITDFIEDQKLYKFNIQCGICHKIKNINTETVYFCLCKKNLCSLCAIDHAKNEKNKKKDTKEHKIEKYENKFTSYHEHGEKYECYCKTCNLNLCFTCEENHDSSHRNKIVYFKQIKNYTKLNEIKNIIEESNKIIKIYKKELIILKDIFNKMMINIILNYENNLLLNEYFINSLKNLDNYETIKTINEFNYRKIIKDINSFLKLNIKDKFKYLIENLYNKNMSSQQLELLYYQKPGKEIKILNKEFVENNKNNCYLIINNEIKDLCEKYECKKKLMSEPIKINLLSLEPIKDMKNMFYECDSIKIFNSLNFDTNEVTNMSNMFNGCIFLSSIKGKLNTKKVTKMNNMFKNCSSLTNIENISNWDLSSAIDISYLFFKCSKLINISDFLIWDTSQIKYMNYLFCGCYSLGNIPDISFWNTTNVVDLSHMFEGCSQLKYLPDISKWNIVNVTDISHMFNGCVNLKSLPDISNWNTSKVTKMSHFLYDCESLSRLPDISKWNTINVTKMDNMFYYCRKLLSIPDISNWNISNCKDISQMFYKCESLNNLPDISKWDIKKKKDFDFGCNSIKKSSTFHKIESNNNNIIYSKSSEYINNDEDDF